MAFWSRIGGLRRLRSLLTHRSTGWLHVAHRTAPERRWTADLERNLNVLHFHGSSTVHFTPFVFIPPQKSSQLSPNRDRSFPSHDSISRRGLSSARDKSQREKGAGALLTNEEIVAEHVRLVTDEGHGIVTRWEALERARKLGLDLVEVSHDSDPPVCKIMDFHKEKFRKQAIVKERAKKAKADTSLRVEHKEVKFQGKIEKRDLEMKANMVKKLMERGYRVKITAEAKKRRSSSNAEKEDLSEVLSRLYNLVEDVSIVESPPSVQEKMAYMVVRHAKFGTKKKNAKKIMASDEDDDLQESSIQQPSVGAPEQTMVPKFFESGSEPDGRRIAPSFSNARQPAMENSRSDPSWKGIKVAPGMGKAKSDFESDPRSPHLAPAPNPRVTVPPAPEMGNRYMKSGPGRNAAARNPYQPSRVYAQQEGLRNLKPRNSDPEHLNHPGRGPLRPTYERQQDYGDSGTKPVSGMSSNSAARTPSQPSWVNTRKVGRLDTEARNSDPENFNPQGRAPLRPSFTRQQKYNDSDRNPEGSPPAPSSPRKNFGVFSYSSSDTTAPKPGSK